MQSKKNIYSASIAQKGDFLMKGYKVFNPDWTCRGYQCEVGKTFEEDVKPKCCDSGFHFCTKASDCFNYYRFDPNNKVAEVEAVGDIDTHSDDTKCSTNKLHIIREITWQEVLELVNLGKACTGLCNSGNRNSGNCNSGNWNSGNWNSGNWNKTSNAVGCFNTESQKLKFFDKETDMTFEQWWNSDARYLLNQIDFRPADWIWSDDMTDEEKAAHPEHETTGGYLKIRDNTDCCTEWWNGLSERNKNIIRSIPNFDAEKFYQITRIRA